MFELPGTNVKSLNITEKYVQDKLTVTKLSKLKAVS
jgi:hypothetical protein